MVCFIIISKIKIREGISTIRMFNNINSFITIYTYNITNKLF
nr:MAG TPA: WASH complex subunit 7 [Caudoviricetes sp.]